MIQFLMAPLEDSDSERVRELSSISLELIDVLYHEMRPLQCGMLVFDAAVVPTTRILEEIWPPVKTDFIHIVAVMSCVVSDMRRTLKAVWSAAPAYDTDEVWKKFEAILDEVYSIFDPDGKEEYAHVENVMPIHSRLISWLFPEKQVRDKPLRLYLAGERLWIAHHTKAEARELLRLETGLSKLPLEGIALGEILGDGQPASVLLARANGKPSIIGRAL